MNPFDDLKARIAPYLKNTVNDGKPVFFSYFFAFLIILSAFGLRVFLDEHLENRIFVTYLLAFPFIAIFLGFGPGVFALLFSIFLVYFIQPLFIAQSSPFMNGVMHVFALVYLGYTILLLVYLKRVIRKSQDEQKQKINNFEGLVRDQENIIALTQSAINRASDVIIIAKADPMMHVVYVNQAFTRLTGYTSQEIVGKTSAILHGPNTDKNTIELIKQALRNQKSIRIDLLNYKKNGQEFWVELDMAPIFNSDQVLTHWVSIEREVTDRKAYEASLLWGQKQARMALEARALFIAKMSHEIRTPMTAIVGLSTLALRQPDSSKTLEYLNSIHNSSLTLMKVLNDILDFSKLESGSMSLEERPFKLALLVSDIQNLFFDAASLKNIRLNCTFIGDNEMIVLGDRFRLVQIISNLVGNAIKFTDTGTVDFSIDVIGSDDDSAHLLVAIKDTGIGIPLGVQKDVMTSFSQADSSLSRRYGGTGLGLTIASELLQRMKSDLSFKSLEGVGSEFYFSLKLFLPLSPKEDLLFEELSTPSDIQYPAPKETPDLTGRVVLLVEDNVINQVVVSEFLKAAKASVHIANNGRDAITMLAEFSFDAILMDIQMPELDGYETTKIIRSIDSLASIPIIGISAGVSEKEISLALASGMDDFIPKPVNPEFMIEILHQHIRNT